MKQILHRILKFDIRSILPVLLIAIVSVVLNAPYTYQPVGGWTDKPLRSFDYDIGKFPETEFASPVQAGWPATFYVSHSFEDGTTYSSWHYDDLMANLLIVVAVAVMTFGYQRYRFRQNGLSSTSRFSLSLADLLLIVAIVAMPLGLYQFNERAIARARNEIKELKKFGLVHQKVMELVAWKPYLPTFLMRPVPRVTQVDLIRPSNEVMSLLVEQPYLRSIRIGGGDYQLDHFRGLGSMRYLQDLRISGREIDGATVVSLSRCPLIRSLNLSRTNLNDSALDRLAEMPRLERLMAMDTAVDLAAWNPSKLKAKLKTLTLSRPPTRQAGSIELTDWPNLESVHFRSLDEFVNRKPFRIRIAGMEKLRTIGVDVFQLVDLELEKLPELISLEEERWNDSRRVADAEWASSSLWVRNLRLQDVPRLTELVFHPKNILSVSVSGCDSLDEVVMMTWAKEGPVNQKAKLELSREAMQLCVDRFATTQGVSTLDFTGFDFTEVDVKPLGKLQSLKKLRLHHCKIPRSRAAEFAGLNVESLSLLSAVDSDAKLVNTLSRSLRQLREMEIDQSYTAIRLEDQPNLETLKFLDHNESRIEALRLVNVPRLVTPVLMTPWSQYCVVENAPSIRGIGIPIRAAKLSLSQVGGLEWFFAGGKQLDDKIVTEVLKAKPLKHLTLAHCSASPAAFNGIVELKALQSLRIPGCQLDPAVLKEWNPPPNLTVLDVEGCGLPASVISRLLELKHWKELRLSGNELPADLFKKLAQLKKLETFSISGEVITPQRVKQLSTNRVLVRLGVTDCTFEPGTLRSMVDRFSPSITQIDLTDSQFESKDVRALAASHPRLKLRIDPVAVSSELATELMSEGRIVSEDDLFYQVFGGRGNRNLTVTGMRPNGSYIYLDTKAPAKEFKMPQHDTDIFKTERF